MSGKVILVGLLVLLAGCGELVSPAEPGAPLSEAEVLGSLVAADDSRDRAFVTADAGALTGAFTADGARPLVARLAAWKRAGLAMEEVPEKRLLVHWRALGDGGEGVLEIHARQRMLRAGSPPGPWSGVLRQWRARLLRTALGWRVAEADELPPLQWWKAGAGIGAWLRPDGLSAGHGEPFTAGLTTGVGAREPRL